MENNVMNNTVTQSSDSVKTKNSLSKKEKVSIIPALLLCIYCVASIFINISTMNWNAWVLQIVGIIACIVITIAIFMKKLANYYAIALPILYLALSQLVGIFLVSKDSILYFILSFIIYIVFSVILIIGYIKNNKVLKIFALLPNAFFAAVTSVNLILLLLNEVSLPPDNSPITVILSVLMVFVHISVIVAIIFTTDFKKREKPQAYFESVVSTPVQSSAVQSASVKTTPDFSIADKLAEYKELLDMGAITQEEFDKKKNELLNG